MRKVWRMIRIKGNVSEIRENFTGGSVFLYVPYLFPHNSNTSSIRSGSSHSRNEPNKIPAINSNYGAATQSQVFRSMLSRALQIQLHGVSCPRDKVRYIWHNENKQYLYQKFINDIFLCY
jgi:hypothetical protein